MALISIACAIVQCIAADETADRGEQTKAQIGGFKHLSALLKVIREVGETVHIRKCIKRWIRESMLMFSAILQEQVYTPGAFL